ncbi:NHP2-like protein 1 (NHP2L1) [Vairimorpha necatrix]|uniref:H/ACA ribonucleoprotein complex subunit 2 n=1 Tax=Vairimorpha necatrix TaxID=6039 RepID=A0AAX4JBA6_9MICR
MEENHYESLNEDNCKKIYDFVMSMNKSKNIKKGVNEVTKCINKGTAHLVIIAVDAEPPEITFSLPLLCEDKGKKFAHVQSKRSLGKACSLERPVIACCVYIPKDKEGLRIEEKIKELLD